MQKSPLSLSQHFGMLASATNGSLINKLTEANLDMLKYIGGPEKIHLDSFVFNGIFCEFKREKITLKF